MFAIQHGGDCRTFRSKLSEASDLYRECFSVDPNDGVARGGLPGQSRIAADVAIPANERGLDRLTTRKDRGEGNRSAQRKVGKLHRMAGLKKRCSGVQECDSQMTLEQRGIVSRKRRQKAVLAALKGHHVASRSSMALPRLASNSAPQRPRSQLNPSPPFWNGRPRCWGDQEKINENS
jgi:hypothetical protein